MPEKQPIPENAIVLSHRLADILQREPEKVFTRSDFMDYFIIPEKYKGAKKQIYSGLRIDIYRRFSTALNHLVTAGKSTCEKKNSTGGKRPRTIYYKYKPQTPPTNA